MLGVTLGHMAWAVVGFCVLAGVVDGRVKVIDEEVGLRQRQGVVVVGYSMARQRLGHGEADGVSGLGHSLG